MKCHPTEVEVETLFNRIETNELNLQPDFQRGEVWKENKKKKLIDSILRGWKIPPVHLIEREDYIDEVLDGQQRLAAIRDFMKDMFPIDGNIIPFEDDIHKLDGLFYSQLPGEVQRKFKHYSLSTIRLTEYKPTEPAELFFRLNQPVALTSAEQRNAFIGQPRDQVKLLTSKFEKLGASKELLGFSNSRMAYDEIISKLCYAIENKNISKKITSAQISEQYRTDKPFSSETIESVYTVLEKFISSIKQITNISIMFSKASIFSWFIFLHTNLNYSVTEYSELISLFEFSRTFVKGNKKNETCIKYVDLYNNLKKKFPYFEVLLNIYNQRASMGSTDGLSIVQRDLILNLFTNMQLNNNDKLLIEFSSKVKHKDSISSCLDELIHLTKWGETI